MQRLLPAILLLILASGCGTSPTTSETTREVVLQYIGTDVGTAGPFGKGGKKELDVLSDADRQKVEALIDRGAVIFLVYGGSAPDGTRQSGVSRVIVVQNNNVIGDFRAKASAAPAPAPASAQPAS